MPLAAACLVAVLTGCASPGLSPDDPIVQAKRPLTAAADFDPPGALLLGCNELIRYHPRVFVDVVRATVGQVPLLGLVASEAEHRHACRLLDHAKLPLGAVRFLIAPVNTMWVRDYGPMFVRGRDGSALLVNARYPSTPQKEPRTGDDALPVWLGKRLGLPVVAAPLKIEGGSLLSNGEGLLVASTVVLGRNRNRGRDEAGVRQALADCLGCRRVLFLQPLQGEVTRHVDMFVCFLAPHLAVVARCDPAKDPENARILDAAADALAGLPTSRGPMQVHRIPMPPRPKRGWRTYTNVIFAGKALLVPSYTGVDDGLQREAHALYARLAPGRKIVPVNADSLALKNGSLHCISLNVPDFVRAKKKRGK
jgi:agmatine/peptidylarginine deiminase